MEQKNEAAPAGVAGGAPVGELPRPWNADIEHWEVEDETFWKRVGRKVAYRNLWISVPCLLMGFAVWLMWGIITVQMYNLGFPFTETELFTLSAIAGLTGATLRIPASFFIRISGGRNTIFFTTSLLILPALGAGFALQSQETPLWVFQLLAFLSGIGGGNFACSMSNISTFFPKRQQGLALGINAGLGNFGVTTMQLLIPAVMTVGIFGVFAGDPMILERASGTLIGRIEAGTPTYIQNAALIWVVFLVPLSILAWFGMNNLKPITPGLGNPFAAFGKITGLYVIGLVTTAIGLYLHLPEPVGLGLLNIWFTMLLIIVLTLILMRLVPGDIKPNLARQFKIFNDKHTWSMTILYILTFGSFIGFSMALPLSITVIFGQSAVLGADGQVIERVANPNAPSALTYAWMGPFIGAIIRPPGGWLSDKLGGALITQVVAVVMVAASAGVGYILSLAYVSPEPEQYFFAFLGLFLVLFAASGIGNGSTFRTIGVVFNQEQKGPVLGWTSAVAAYGAFVAPQVIGQQIRAGTPEMAFYGFAVFYALCLILNWWFYLRPNAYVKNP